MATTSKSSDASRGDAQPPAGDPLYVAALARGMSVLKCCAEAPVDPTVSDIAKLLGMPQSTVWRSCYTLLKHGFLVRTQGDRLRPGLAVLGLVHATLTRQPLAELARPGMEAIAARFGGTVSLGVAQGTDMLYLARIEGGTTIYAAGLTAGSRVGVLSSAMGWAWLAALPQRSREAFLAKAKVQAREQYKRVAAPLKEALRSYEDHGVLVSSALIHPELNAVAVAVDADGQVPAAILAFGGLQADYPARRLLNEVAPQLKTLAAELSSSIAHGVAVR